MSRPTINARSDLGLVKAGAVMRSNMVSELPEERASAQVEPDGFPPVMRIRVRQASPAKRRHLKHQR